MSIQLIKNMPLLRILQLFLKIILIRATLWNQAFSPKELNIE